MKRRLLIRIGLTLGLGLALAMGTVVAVQVATPRAAQAFSVYYDCGGNSIGSGGFFDTWNNPDYFASGMKRVHYGSPCHDVNAYVTPNASGSCGYYRLRYFPNWPASWAGNWANAWRWVCTSWVVMGYNVTEGRYYRVEAYINPYNLEYMIVRD